MSGKSNAAAEEKGKDEAPPPKAKGLPPMVIKIAVLLGVLVVLLGAAVAVVTFVIAPKLRAQAPAAAETTTAAHEEAASKGEHKGGKHEHGEILELGDVVVNPANTGGRRYLKVSVSLEVKDAKVAKAVEHRAAPIKDLLVRNLSARTLDELTDPTTKEEMREQLVEQVGEMFDEGSIINLYFTEYVVQ
ncbi:MAG: flagellar basal body-associated FliL family protein [Candidatus Eisenbacteria bacterium]